MPNWDDGDDQPLELDLDYGWNTANATPTPAPPPRLEAPQPLPDPSFGDADDDSLDLEPLDLDAHTPTPGPSSDVAIAFVDDLASPPVRAPSMPPGRAPSVPPMTRPIEAPPSSASPMGAAPFAPPGFDDAPLELDVPAPASAAAPESSGDFTCPKCGRPQPPSDTCGGCGVIFAKLKAGRAPSGVSAPAIAAPPIAPADAPIVQGDPVEPGPPVVAGVADGATVDKAFWPGVLRCLVAPFNGLGALWLVILTVVLVVASVLGGFKGLILKLGYIGLLANYFAMCASQALNGERTAPELKKPNDIQSEYVLPGLALIGLSLILWMPAILTMGSIVLGAVPSEAAALDEDAPVEEQIDGWNPDEVFRFPDGDFREFEFGDPPAIAKRSDGNWVKVIPDEGILLIIGPDYDPASGDPFGGQDSLYGEDGEVAMSSEDAEDAAFADAWAELDVPVGKFILFLLFCFLALYYWPMGLAVAALGESIVRTFNPVVVLGCAARAGLPYLVVVGAGFVVVMIAMLIASQLSWVLATIVTLASVGYNAGAQGFLMGWIIASNPELEAAVSGS